MKKKILILAAVAATLAINIQHAHAGFVDMTASAMTGPSGRSLRVEIDEAARTPAWDQVVPAQHGAVNLPAAISLLLPRDLPGMRLHIDPSLEGAMVSWDGGMTRRQVLGTALPNGVLVKVTAGNVHVLRIADMEVAPSGNGPQAQGQFTARPSDKTLRQTVARWAPAAGWVFEDSYWDLDRDIPVVASSTFTGTFKQAVLGLLATTEVTDLPAKPCFYTNNVVRVVPKAEKCDKTKQD